MKEEWREIEGYEGLYEVSNLGRVKRVPHYRTDVNGRRLFYGDKLLKSRVNKCGYLTVVLTDKKGLYLMKTVHKLVARAFIPNPDNLPCVNHKDENKQNPIVTNLEWCTYSYNNTYGTLLERRKRKPKVSAPEDSMDINLRYQNDEKISECFDRKKKHQKFVIQIDTDGNEVERYASVSEAGRKNGFDRHLFTRTKTVNGVKIIKEKLFIVETKENERIPKGSNAKRPDLAMLHMKPVLQYSKDGAFIREYPSIQEAAKAIGKENGGGGCISNCCNGKLSTAYGYIWRHKGEDAPEPFKHKNKRKIEQYSMDGEFIAQFGSISDAVKHLGGGATACIGSNLSGRTHSAFGYIWKYAK